MSDIYLSLTETPSVVTLSQPVVSGVLSSNVTVTNVVSVNVVTMPAITVQAAAPSVTTVAGTVAVSNFPASQVVSVSNFPASSSVTIGGFSTSNLPPSTVTVANTVTIAGTVTANLSANLQNEVANGLDEYASNYNTPLPISLPVGVTSLPISGTVTANIAEPAPGVNTFISESGSFSPAYAVGIGYNTANNAEFLAVNDSGNNFPVAVNNSVTIGSLPAISGTVTANVFGKDNTGTPQQLKTDAGGTLSVSASGSVQCVDEEGLIFGSDRNFPISGTVTVSNSVTIGSLPAISGTVTVSAISTSVTARLVDSTGTAVSYAATGSAGTPSTDVISVQGVSGGTSLPISGTAGTLTTRFGSVTTANTAQISSAVTNTSRKYLLIQNVTTSSNVITIGIGFTPTTTQGIQLTAGAGITFESSYIPTGAVYVLSSVTASPFTILEA